ncbi:hypothetical protein HBH56_067710 [Parastagonospora nodorum]|uniref:HMG box domain-containing protein n=1 Tax=Phaeosphaeria nodorum (strain SN15 / ATCC MYA-4574 / FGSC 10173) TaxID=321614 RepID=A0A7U2HVJ1_PHANO|nr:hypothetical protein HBH56_067710 [Parastagonospora nodorum]QRC93450.1 hypothetical protein JI435_036740 [Parastagonospora nodorum SN15]KAH3932311.1 hypothetical protein HBH54_080400 [Parastagonospora nodorum]KAH3986383.1 hypothetical protein HBH52_045190 [Parastagonospora nodorum]KAH4071281.1 hypothetical protein HBH50_078740 [Parastagonospora nodorum]
MSDLKQRLARLGLSQYLDAFTAEGFDTWETVLDITESDLSLLNVKLGHRRKLQRAIAETRGQTSDRPLPISLGRAGSAEASYRSGDESATETNRKQGETNTNGAGVKGTATKRKYRRHPKPDEHAPERPPSAYVIFSNQIRELLKGQELSFTEIAKVVGERWQVLPTEERETCERQANTAKEKYYAELADYKKTPQYEAYQKYLEDFKAKHAVPTKGKRSKLETETSTSTRSSSHDQHERASNRRLSSVQPDPSAIGIHGNGASPPTVPGRLPPGSTFLSKPTSPASHATLNSPRTIDHYSPISASPRSSLFDISSAIPPRDSRGPPDANYPYLPSAYSHPPMQQPASTTPPSHPSTTRYQAPVDLPSRRSMREPTRLPPLSREDTTWSSESGHSGSGYSITPSLFPGSVLPLDPQKTMRMLPQPVPSIGPSASLDRPPPAQLAQLSGHPSDYRTQGSLAALVRAGELAARVADEEAMDVEGSSISP